VQAYNQSESIGTGAAYVDSVACFVAVYENAGVNSDFESLSLETNSQSSLDLNLKRLPVPHLVAHRSELFRVWRGNVRRKSRTVVMLATINNPFIRRLAMRYRLRIALRAVSGGISESVAGYPNRAARTHPTSRKTITNPPATNQRRSGTTVPRETGTKSSSTAMNL
jgi:hypothetical protein